MARVRAKHTRAPYRLWSGKRITPALIARWVPPRPLRPKPPPTGIVAGRGLTRKQITIRQHQRGMGPVDDVLFRLTVEGVDEFTVAEREEIRRGLVGFIAPAHPGQE